MTPAVSVLMPVLNPHPVYFPEAVASIVGQTFANWELVIVEDPSPSSATELLKPFNDPRIRLISNPAKTGLVAQLNQGLRESRADLVARMDADDVSEPSRLGAQIECFRQRPALDVLGTQIDVIDTHGVKCGYRAYPITHAAILRALPAYNPLAHPSTMFRKEVVLRQGGYSLQGPAEDYDLWSRLALAGAQFENLPNAHLRYRIHPGAAKGQKLRAMLASTLEVKRLYWWHRMTTRDRLRYRAEQFLQLLPAGMVYRLFSRMTYRRRLVVAVAT